MTLKNKWKTNILIYTNMKLLYTALTIALLAGSHTATAQTVPAKPATELLSAGPEYDTHFKKLKELYLKELRSESYKKSVSLHKAFLKKLPNEAFTTDDQLAWIKDNLPKTQFESYEAAEKEWQEIMAAGMASIEDNKEYYDYMVLCFSKCEPQILTDMMMEVQEEHPELVFD